MNTASLEHVHATLLALTELLPQWETEQELRETSDGTHSHAAPAPDTLPFGLDKTLNSDSHTRTQAGAYTLLKTILCEWEATLTPPAREHHDILTRLILLAPAAHTHYTPTEWDAYAARFDALRRDALAHTGRSPKTTSRPCLTCHTLLEQPYTDEGLLDIYVCPRCGNYWTPDAYMSTAKAHALYSGNDCIVTRQQAAHILGITHTALAVRIHRGKIRPVSGRGHDRRYRLSQLTTSTD